VIATYRTKKIRSELSLAALNSLIRLHAENLAKMSKSEIAKLGCAVSRIIVDPAIAPFRADGFREEALDVRRYTGG